MAPRPNTIPKTDPPVLLPDATEKDLRYWIGVKLGGLTGQYAGSNLAWAKEARAVLISRGIAPADVPAVPDALPPAGAAPPSAQRAASNGAAPATSSALVQAAPAQMVLGSMANHEAINRALTDAATKYHLVSPATFVGRLPEGCEVVTSLVQIDPYSRDVYTISAKNYDRPGADDTVGLDRASLARIASAAGVTWVSSKRTDDGSHPHYCAWEAIARFPNFDMTAGDFPGNVDIDTREDGEIRGAAAQEIRTKAEKRRREHPDWSNDGGDSQLLELRKFLIRHCESKAMNKAIATKGVLRSYRRDDLKKAFFVARLSFTGFSTDPEARRDFRQGIMQRFLGASHQMYGGGPTQQMAPPRLAPAQQYPYAPPPIGTSLDQGSYDEQGERVIDAPQPQPTPKPVAAPDPPAASTAPAATAPTSTPAQEEFRT